MKQVLKYNSSKHLKHKRLGKMAHLSSLEHLHDDDAEPQSRNVRPEAGGEVRRAECRPGVFGRLCDVEPVHQRDENP